MNRQTLEASVPIGVPNPLAGYEAEFGFMNIGSKAVYSEVIEGVSRTKIGYVTFGADGAQLLIRLFREREYILPGYTQFNANMTFSYRHGSYEGIFRSSLYMLGIA